MGIEPTQDPSTGPPKRFLKLRPFVVADVRDRSVEYELPWFGCAAAALER